MTRSINTKVRTAMAEEPKKEKKKSDENKRETKLKINSLVKQIDDCISKLSD